MKRVLICCLAVGLAGLLTIVGYFIWTGGFGLPVRWELPPGYKGWVVLRYLDASCKWIERRGLFLVIKVPQDGKACTSDFLARRWRYNLFEYVHADGSRTKVETPWGESEYRPGGGLLDRWFIGTEAEFTQSGQLRPPIEWHDENVGRTHSSDASNGSKKRQ